jgi:hypothetical protein
MQGYHFSKPIPAAGIEALLVGLDDSEFRNPNNQPAGAARCDPRAPSRGGYPGRVRRDVFLRR